MSNPQTKFLVGGLDLSSIFQPISLGTAYPTATGYKIPGGNDLNQIFAAYSGSGTKANTTGYQLNGNDLCNIFAKFNNIAIYSNTNGTETRQTVYNKVLFNWTAPISGYFTQFQITATGATNNGNLINIILNRLDQNGNFISSIIGGQWYTFPTYQTQTISANNTYLNANDQIYLDYSTLQNGRYFDCLVRSDSVPVISIYIQPA